MDDDELTKADQFGQEPSRWGPGRGHAPTYASEQLRRRAASGLGEDGALQLAVSRMMRADASEDPRLRPTPHVMDAEDVTRGLGLERGDDARIQTIVRDAPVRSTQKTQTQGLILARGRLLSTMRESMTHVEADKRDEIVRRAIAYWKRNNQTDYGKAPTVRFRGGEMSKAIPVLTIPTLLGPRQPKLVVRLEKGEARGGKYYRRVPYTDGKGRRRYRYYYNREDYERAYGDEHHAHGPEVLAERAKKSARERVVALVEKVRELLGKVKAVDPRRADEIGRSARIEVGDYRKQHSDQFDNRTGDPKTEAGWLALERIYTNAGRLLYRELAPTKPPAAERKKRPEPSTQLGLDFAGVQAAPAPGGETTAAEPANVDTSVAAPETVLEPQPASAPVVADATPPAPAAEPWQSPTGIYRVVADGDTFVLQTKRYNRSTKKHGWEPAKRGFRGTREAVMAEARRREEVIARKRDGASSGPSGPSGEGGRTRVGGNTFTARTAIKQHGGVWDKATKTWLVPSDRVGALKEALGARAEALTYEPEAPTAPSPAPEPAVAPTSGPSGPSGEGAAPAEAEPAAVPPPSAKVTAESMLAEAEALARQLGISEDISVHPGSPHAIFGRPLVVSVRSKGKAAPAARKLMAELQKRWRISQGEYREVRIGQSYGTSGWADGTRFEIKVWPDMMPGSTTTAPQFRPDSDRAPITGNPERAKALVRGAREAYADLVASYSWDKVLAFGEKAREMVELLTQQGDLLAIAQALSDFTAFHKEVSAAANATRKFRSLPQDDPRRGTYLSHSEVEGTLRIDVIRKLGKVLAQEPPKTPTSGPSGPSGPSGESTAEAPTGATYVPDMNRADLEQHIRANNVVPESRIEWMSTDQLREALTEWMEAGNEVAGAGSRQVVQPEPEPAAPAPPPKPAEPVEAPSAPATSNEAIRAAITARVEAEQRAKWAEFDRAKAEGRVQYFGTKAPPGGWPEQTARQKALLEESRKKIREQTLREKIFQEIAKHAHFAPNSIIKVDGREFKIVETDDQYAARFPNLSRRVRNVELTPHNSRMKTGRTLVIWPSGQVELHNGRQREIVRSLEGYRLTEEKHPFHAAADAPPPARPETPDDLPETPPEPAPTPEPTPPRPEPSSGPSGPSGPSGTRTPPRPAPEGTPRGDANAARKREEVESEYVNDRASKIEMRGEDVVASARHKALEWKSLREASTSADAEKLFTRDFLAKQEPIDFISRVQNGLNPALAVLLYYTSRKFPGKPEMLGRPREGRTIAYLGNKPYERVAGSNTGISYYGARGYTVESGENAVEVSYEEHQRRQRESYYEAYQIAKGIIEKHFASGDSDLRATRSSIAQELRNAHAARAQTHSTSDAGTEALRVMYNAAASLKKTSPIAQANDFAKRFAATYSDISSAEQLVKARDVAMSILEGKSLNAAFGTVQGKKKDRVTDLATLYNTNKMHRQGPPSEYRGIKQGLDLLDKDSGGKYQMRAVQWGKSVTDEEREHHLKSVVDSMADLTGILGLPPEMASFNGRLALAIGARGKGGALAHYEPQLKVINLTRANGAGALAHEWGHFFDYIVGEVGLGQFATSAVESVRLQETRPVLKEMMELQTSAPWQRFREKCLRVLGEEGITGKKANYWSSREEMFARCFERLVQRKLEKAGRANTYLTGLETKLAATDNGLWPTDAEVDALEPWFDRIFAAFRNSELLHKALHAMGRPPLVRAAYAHLVGNKLVVRR